MYKDSVNRDSENDRLGQDAVGGNIVAEDELGLNDDKEAAAHIGLGLLGFCNSIVELLRAVPPLVRSIFKKSLVLLKIYWAVIVKVVAVVLSKLHIFLICGRALWKLWILIVRLEVYILTVGTHVVVPKACVEDDHLSISE